jgi:hypothetical protein
MAKQIALILLFALSAFAQSFSPRQPVDFSAVTTKPIQVGTAAPATCAVGQVYFDSDATAGQNLYLCTATNTWTQLTGTGGSGAGVGVCSTAGTSTAYTCTVSGLTLSAGVVLRIKPHTASGNAPTLNVNGTGAVALYWRNGNAVTTNELSPNWWDITYTGSAWEITETTVGIDTSLTGALSITRSGGLEKIVKGSLLCLTTDACSPTGARVYSASAKTAPFRIGSSDPATCDHTVREAFYNTTLDVVKFCTAANTWTTLTGSGMADPMTTRGDLIYRGASGTTRLALGTNGQCLTSNGTDAVWGSCSATGNVTASGTLTLNAPVIGAGTTAVSVGSRTGNTTEFVTQSGAKTAGKQATYDANGNLIASAYDVGASGSGGGTFDAAAFFMPFPAPGGTADPNGGNPPGPYVCHAFVPPLSKTFSKLGFYVGSPSTGADKALVIGIHDADHDLLGYVRSVNPPTASTVVSAFNTPVALEGGKRYYQCWSVEDGSSAINVAGAGNFYFNYLLRLTGSTDTLVFEAGTGPTGAGATYTPPSNFGSRTGYTLRVAIATIFVE